MSQTVSFWMKSVIPVTECPIYQGNAAKTIGTCLYLFMDDRHDAAKVLKGFGGAGVLEVVEDDIGGTYRAVYTVKFAEAVFVLHCFQKKSKRGIATPKEDMDIIHARLKIAEAFAKELRK